ncbi:MAG: hypothetical protein FIB07_09590 [Candidatus Methanoperedens sp.]|nr:hypothetical protein [Candidatus Methanoperedens sp.]
MSTAEIALFIIIVFLFIIAIYLFVLLRKSHEKKQYQEQEQEQESEQEQEKIEYKDIAEISPEFRFENPGLNNVDIHQIKDLMKPATDAGITEPDRETISIEEKIRRQKRDLKISPDVDNKIHEIKNNIQEESKTKDEIPKTEPDITKTDAKEDINVTVTMTEDVSGLKLEDTLTGIEEEKKRRRKISTKKSGSTIKKSIVSPAKPLIGETEKPGKKRVRKKKAVKAESVPVK